jgi:hypothetical protein
MDRKSNLRLRLATWREGAWLGRGIGPNHCQIDDCCDCYDGGNN